MKLAVLTFCVASVAVSAFAAPPQSQSVQPHKVDPKDAQIIDLTQKLNAANIAVGILRAQSADDEKIIAALKDAELNRWIGLAQQHAGDASAPTK